MSIPHQINDGRGYCPDYRLANGELKTVRNWITSQYLDRIAELDEKVLAEAERLGIQNYHKLETCFDHATAWPKIKRILSPRLVENLRTMKFFQAIESQFGPVEVSDEELNWRLVRPGVDDDIGPVHQDKWFWDLGYGTLPPGYERFKIWIAIYTESGCNGLCVKSESHRKGDWTFHVEINDGMRKPVADEAQDPSNLELLDLEPGQIVMFHDELLHGGVPNHGAFCRVSLELTIFYRPNTIRTGLDSATINVSKATRSAA